MKSKHISRNSKKVAALSLLVALEIVFGLYIYQMCEPQIHQAYIVKNGVSYLLLWKNEENETISKQFSYLHQALQFAGESLNLHIGPNPNFQASVDAVWSRDDMGKRLVFWTIGEGRNTNRLTFNRSYEADVFKAAFLQGAYTTSPFGHSLSLVPKLSTH